MRERERVSQDREALREKEIEPLRERERESEGDIGAKADGRLSEGSRRLQATQKAAQG